MKVTSELSSISFSLWAAISLGALTNISAQELKADGIKFDIPNTLGVGPNVNVPSTLTLYSYNGGIDITTFDSHNLDIDFINFYGSPIDFLLGYNDLGVSRFSVSSDSGSGAIFEINAANGATTFKGTHVIVTQGTLSVEGSQVITAATASGVLTSQNFAKFSSTNTLNVPAGTVSTSSTTGALTVSGGIGAGKDSYVNGVRVGRGGMHGIPYNQTNIALGGYSLNSSTGAFNVAVGENSMTANTIGSSMVAVGYDALKRNTTGNGNTAVGAYTLEDNTTGTSNTSVGVYSLAQNTSASHNTAHGAYALGSMTTGIRNVGIGYAAGHQRNGSLPLENSYEGIYIGYYARGQTNNEINSIVIGAHAVGAGSNTTSIGNISTTHTYLKGKTMLAAVEVAGAALVKGSSEFQGNVEVKADAKFEGNVILSTPQGDISMGIYE